MLPDPYTPVNSPVAESRLESYLSIGSGQYGQPRDKATLPAWVARIRAPNERDAALVARARELRAAGDKDGYDAQKAESAWATIAGDYSATRRRRRQDPWVPSGMAFLELDSLPEGETAAQARDRLFTHPAVIAAWVSIGGAGVHLAVAINPGPTTFPEHHAAWYAAVERLGLPPEGNDRAVKNPNRIVYLSHDPDAKIKAPWDAIEPVAWELPPEPEAPPPKPSKADGSSPPPPPPGANPISLIPNENRSAQHFTARLITDFAGDLVIASDGTDSKVYLCDPETGLLTHGTGEFQALFAQTCGGIIADAIAAGLEDKAIAGLSRWLSRLIRKQTVALIDENAAGAIATIRRLGHGHLLPEIHHPSAMDGNPSVWGCLNGLLNIQSLTILHPGLARKYLVTANTGVPYDADAQHPAVDKILPKAQSDIADYYGWAAAHEQHRDCAAEISSPGSGKSTRRKAFRSALGPQYVTSTREETLQRQKYNKGGTAHNAGVFAFARPAKFTFVQELAGGDLDRTLLNEITGDEVEIQGRKPGEEEKPFIATSHLIMQGNHAAQGTALLGLSLTDGGDNVAALIDRLRVFDIPDLPPEERDDTLRDQIFTPEFAQAMLARIAWHANRMLDYGNTAPESETMRQRLESQIRSERPAWITECLEPNIVLNGRNLDPDDAFAEANAGTPLNSYHIRERLKEWWNDHECGRVPGAILVTKALIAIAGPPDRRGKVDKASGGRANAQIWDRHALAPED